MMWVKKLISQKMCLKEIVYSIILNKDIKNLMKQHFPYLFLNMV